MTPALTLAEAVGIVVPLLDDELVVHANGYISRESCQFADRPGNFYMIGSMGLSSSIGLGVALSRPERRVLVFDGDGNVLMNMGSLALIGAQRPHNLVHVVFDNEVYGSTGNQPTISNRIALDEVARASGYVTVRRAETVAHLDAAARELLARDTDTGPSFLLVKIAPDRETRSVGRIPHTPPEIARRFMAALSSPSPQPSPTRGEGADIAEQAVPSPRSLSRLRPEIAEGSKGKD